MLILIGINIVEYNFFVFKAVGKFSHHFVSLV